MFVSLRQQNISTGIMEALSITITTLIRLLSRTTDTLLKNPERPSGEEFWNSPGND